MGCERPGGGPRTNEGQNIGCALYFSTKLRNLTLAHREGSAARCTVRESLITAEMRFIGTNPTGDLITSGLPVMLPQWPTANRERQGAPTDRRTTIEGDPFYREWLCVAGRGCRGSIPLRLYIDNCLPLTVELFDQLAFFILSCKPISYCGFKRIDVYIL